MKRIALILGLSLYVLPSIAQSRPTGVYCLPDINNTGRVDCHLILHPSGYYDLELSERTADIVRSTILSHGTYTLRDKQLNTFDLLHGFRMQIHLPTPMQNEIKVEQGFGFLKGRSLLYCHNGYESVYTKRDTNPVKQEQIDIQTLFPIYWETYENYTTGSDYELQIKRENRYALRYKQIIISEGTWTRNRNELSLFDKHLQNPFYALITDKSLISNYLPGDFQGILLCRKKDKPKGLPDSTTLPWTYQASSPPAETKNDLNEPFMMVEEMPQFPGGGDKALKQFLLQNTRYPQSAKDTNVRGRVFVSFIIEKDGSIGSVNVVRGLCESCDKEAVRIVHAMPAWIPGRHNGFPVAVKYMLTIEFWGNE
jgi:protein TonB